MAICSTGHKGADGILLNDVWGAFRTKMWAVKAEKLHNPRWGGMTVRIVRQPTHTGGRWFGQDRNL